MSVALHVIYLSYIKTPLGTEAAAGTTAATAPRPTSATSRDAMGPLRANGTLEREGAGKTAGEVSGGRAQL
jgi:hypothetical protein